MKTTPVYILLVENIEGASKEHIDAVVTAEFARHGLPLRNIRHMPAIGCLDTRQLMLVSPAAKPTIPQPKPDNGIKGLLIWGVCVAAIVLGIVNLLNTIPPEQPHTTTTQTR